MRLCCSLRSIEDVCHLQESCASFFHHNSPHFGHRIGGNLFVGLAFRHAFYVTGCRLASSPFRHFVALCMFFLMCICCIFSKEIVVQIRCGAAKIFLASRLVRQIASASEMHAVFPTFQLGLLFSLWYYVGRSRIIYVLAEMMTI